MICVKGERASSKGYRERRRAEPTVYVDCLRRERIQDLLDAWYAEEGKQND